MALLSSSAELAKEAKTWRHDLHAHPELQYDLPRTSGIVAEKLRSFGCDDVVTGIAKCGVVAVIQGAADTSGKIIGLRADMDALPMQEEGTPNYKSTTEGRMHACGHDGHTSMLLGAAKYLASTRNFDGTAVLVFQPAEENGGAGAKMMLDEGLLERFGIQEVYGMHNRPNVPIGHFSLRPGPMLAASDRFYITITGKGGHAAAPHMTIDPVLVAAHMTLAFQSIVSRNVNPIQSAVLTIGQIQSGFAPNVIPESATLVGTARSFSPDVRALLEKRVREMADLVAQTFGATASVDWKAGYPVTINDAEKFSFASSVAAQLTSPDHVHTNVDPGMGAEDFSYMLEKRPGALIWIGNGPSPGLHHPRYDFNDEALPFGISYWAKIVETAMPAH
jgi:amidohydrolase